MVELQGPSRRRRLIAAAVVFLLSFAFRALHAVDLAPSMGKRGQPGLYMSRMYDDRALEMMLAGDGWLYPANPDPARTGLLAHISARLDVRALRHRDHVDVRGMDVQAGSDHDSHLGGI